MQCGECGDWYHYDCLRINDTTLQTLGDDDYICRMCTDNLLHIDSSTGSNDNEIELNNESIGNHVSGNHDMSLIEPEDESESTQENKSIQKKRRCY